MLLATVNEIYIVVKKLRYMLKNFLSRYVYLGNEVFFVVLLNDVIKEFILEICPRNYSEKTIKGYNNNLLKFAKYVEGEFELIELKDISHTDEIIS